MRQEYSTRTETWKTEADTVSYKETEKCLFQWKRKGLRSRRWVTNQLDRFVIKTSGTGVSK